MNDPRDFVPYLPILLPDLKSTLLDPIPGELPKVMVNLTRSIILHSKHQILQMCAVSQRNLWDP